LIWLDRKRTMIDSISPFGWMMLGGLIALSLAPTVKNAINESDFTEFNYKKIPKASRNALGNVKRNLKSFIDKSNLIEEMENVDLNKGKKKIRVRKRNISVGADKFN
jgi:hypothetical protein